MLQLDDFTSKQRTAVLRTDKHFRRTCEQRSSDLECTAVR